MNLQPQWITHASTSLSTDQETHYYIPPRSGRGNKHDGWTPICGAGIELAPWREYGYQLGAARCIVCIQLACSVEKAMR